MSDDEALYQRAAALVLEHQKASTSWLQRQLRVGYNSAARMIERMETEGYVSHPDAVGRREVLRPPSAAMLGSSVVIQPEVPAWERNAGKYDRPSSSVPTPDADARPVVVERDDPPVIASASVMPLDDAHSALAQALVAALGLEGARRIVRAAGEAMGEVKPVRAADGSASHLEQVVLHVEGLMERRDDANQDIRDALKFAKEIGLMPSEIRGVIADRKADRDKRFEREATRTVYRHALGVEDPDIAIDLPAPVALPPPKGRKLTAKEKAYQETLASIAASRATLIQ
ncbi:hypothetical protein SAQ01S_18000 [Sphingomonas aquatilis NBRC 16722]|uniref:Uncharacterized protein (UPF0335 family) n=2 Tax=Sphingomonas aquatilis TaxID=93063 RepID=A0AAW3TRT7_9SPHN|nr:uncharacterized protein (UPF0335 family) [Sphingomonas aquatilis]GEM72034.1 hypothetical protein SAQ01S_18000 [Sphingomonas aquatilis NBRC 16722]